MCLDKLKLLLAHLELPSPKLTTQYVILPVHCYKTDTKQFYSFQLEFHNITRIRIPVKEKWGPIILLERDIQGVNLRKL